MKRMVHVAGLLLVQMTVRSAVADLFAGSDVSKPQTFSETLSRFSSSKTGQPQQEACCSFRILDPYLHPDGVDAASTDAQNGTGDGHLCCHDRIINVLASIDKPPETSKVAFSAAGIPENVTEAPSKWKPIIFKQQQFNFGEAYNLTSGIFTAKKEGLYHFDLLAFTNETDKVDVGIAKYPEMQILVKGAKLIENNSTTQELGTSITVNVVLAVGAQIAPVYVSGNISSPPAEDHGDPDGLRMSQFSGFLANDFSFG